MRRLAYFVVSKRATLLRFAVLALFALACLGLSWYSLYTIKINGDGGEYLLVTHALFRHGSVAIRPGDIEEIRHLPLPLLQTMNFPGETYAHLQQLFQVAHPLPWGGFASVAPDRYYSIHFWLYPLLAVPFYALLRPFGANPLWSLGLLNLSFAGAVLFYLRRAMPGRAVPGFLFFLTMGSTFYLNWTGPELMSASCALIACLAALRGEIGLSFLLSGLGASQNPSLIFVMPFACLVRIALYKWPQLIWPGAGLKRFGRRDAVMMLAGVSLAMLPYVFFQTIFGVPSLPGRYFTSPDLITANRLFSLLFDLDQGMLIGVPGLFAALLAGVLLIRAPSRAYWLCAAVSMIALMLVMAVPTLSARNWNSGCVVMLRYAYWLAMPLLVVVLLSLRLAPTGAHSVVAASALILQAGVLYLNGVVGQESNSLGHSAEARWVLRYFPGYYNPDAEVFYERSVGSENEMPPDLTYLYQADGHPLKLLRQATNTEATPEWCPADQRLQGVDVHTEDRGWQYSNFPFHCQHVPHVEQLGKWEIGTDHPDNDRLLASGWSKPEPPCIWSDGVQSSLVLPVMMDGRPLRIRTQGLYYGRQNKSVVSVNGHALGNFDLTQAVIELSSDFPKDSQLTVVLRHEDASSPKSHGESVDERILGFCLKSVSVEAMFD
ncbi:MAG: DUF2029 domain-containing protein [Burkholderiaceae bacterium]|nr:DUF2029 domain-containing protein [Burkholderiaceae bacterium]